MEAIKHWLNNRGTYLEGVALLLQTDPAHPLAALFTQESETEFKNKKLKQALLAMFQNQPSSPKPANQPPATVPAVSMEAAGTARPAAPVASEKMTVLSQRVPGRWSDPDARDAVETNLYNQWQPLFLERSNLQSRIQDVARAGRKDPGQKKAAAVMAFRILELARQIRMIYDQRDLYLVDGTQPADPELYASDPIIAAKKLENHRRYVRTFKKKLQKNPGDKEATQTLEKHLAAVRHYESFFKINNGQ